MASQRRRKAFTIEEKEAIIRRLENGESNSSLAKRFGVGHSTISTIYKNKDLIRESFNSNVLKSKRLRKSRQDNVDRALFQWFTITTKKGISISGPMLQEKANDFAARFGIFDFNCSASWISRFKVRRNIVAGKIDGETASVDLNSTTNWLTSEWPALRRQFTDDEIFSANETGLFYKLMPHRTLIFKGERCSKGEMSSERITVMVAANMNGTEKKKLLVIGESQISSNKKSLPVDYAHNNKAWMTSELFEQWLRNWDRDMVEKKKKILLLVNDCLAHLNVIGLKFITLKFLPTNTIAALQPMNQGVIQSLKTNYRKNLVIKIVNYLDNNKNHFSTHISTLNAIAMVNDAWSKVSKTTIQNSFKDAGFSINHGVPASTDKQEYEDDVPFSLWVKNLNLYSLAPLGLWEDYVNIDSALFTSEEPMDEYLIKTEDYDTDRIEEDKEELPTAAQALDAADTLSQFVYSNIKNDNLTTAMSSLHNSVRNFYYNMRKIHSNIFYRK